MIGEAPLVMSTVTEDVRILHITTVARTLGFIEGKVKFMHRRGFSLYSAAGDISGRPRGWNIPLFRVEMPRRITPLRDILAVFRLMLIIEEIHPTIVEGHTPKGGLLAMIASTFSRVPIRVFHVHGLPHVASRGVRRFLLVLATRVSCLLAHRVLCVSNSMRQILVDEKLCSAVKVYVPGNGSTGGVDAGKFNPARYGPTIRSETRRALGISNEAIVLLFAGRIVRDKGMVELVQAWQELRSRFPDLQLVVAGEPESQDPIPALTLESLSNDARIHLVGWWQDMPRLYSASDIAVLPTYREGFSNVLLEAAAMGLPSVATRVPGCTDAVVDGVTGTLVPPYDSAALAEAIGRYVTNAGLRRQHGAAGRVRTLRDFQPEAIYRDVYRCYRDLLCGLAGVKAAG